MLADLWLADQDSLPQGARTKRAHTTLAENRREIKTLCKVFGEVIVTDLVTADAHDYLEACDRAVDESGHLKPRWVKGCKEIALARLILNFGVRKRWLASNPFSGVTTSVNQPSDRYVTDEELSLAVEVGREMRGPQLLVALALKTAWLCTRRSVEVRALARTQISDDGIRWVSGKKQRGDADRGVLIQWTPELRETIDEALAVERHSVAGSFFVFGNLKGQRYTKGGWKATLHKLMEACVARAKERGLPFQRFSLQDCRPKGVTDKLSAGHTDVQDATLHTSSRMIRGTYDRRRTVKATPVR